MTVPRMRSWRGVSRQSSLRAGHALPSRPDLVERVLAGVPPVDLDALLLEVLVDAEEVRDLVAQLLGEVLEPGQRVPVRVAQRDGEDLVVDALVVAHPEQRDRLDDDPAAGERRLAHADHDVERIAGLAAGVRGEPVIGRIDHRREQEAVEHDRPDLLVVFVLVARPLRDLDVGHEGVVGYWHTPHSARHARVTPSEKRVHGRDASRPGGNLMEAASFTQRERITGPRQETETAIPASVTPIADPGPLGLAAFALTTFVLSMFNAKLVGAGGEPVVFGLALAYGGLAQLLAGMWEFKTGNTFGAVAFTSYGAFWISFWAFVQFFEKDVPKADAGHAVGLFLIAWGIFTAYMFIASLRTTAAIATVFALLAATFFLLGIGNANDNTDIIKLGGYVGIATAAAAWYASFAAVTNSTFGRTVLPVKSLKP